MRMVRFGLSVLVLAIFAAVPLGHAASGGGGGGGGIGGNSGLPTNGSSNGGGTGKKEYTPGSQGGIPWGSSDLKAAHELKKPIILYVYDDKVKKENHLVTFFESEIFSEGEVQKLLQGYTCIMVSSSTEWLPGFCLAKAQGGAAVFLMTYDGTIQQFWMKGQRPQLNEFVDMLKSVLASNPKVLERFQKDAPLQLKFPNGAAVDLKPAAADAAKQKGQAVAYAVAPDEDARLDATKRLAAEIAAAAKAGEKLKAWLTLNGVKEELNIATADEKVLSLLVQGNTLPIKWQKLDKEEVYDLSKNIAGDHGDRLLLAGEMAMALGHADEAIAILAKARMADGTLASKIDTLTAKIQNSAAAAPVAPAAPVQEQPKTAEAPKAEGEKAPNQ
ncbi:MAG: hypothetical protein HY291_18630 [Planctomycetes bacterium]|nr:hypothetical protein [Planctomycetota bacterium]